MSIKLQVVSSTTTDPIEDISNSIKKGTWGNVEKNVDLRQFMKKVGPDAYILNANKSLQVKNETLNDGFIKEKVQYVKNTGNRSFLSMPVLVYFPKEVKFEGVVFPNNSWAILDRNHGIMIRANLDIFESDCYVVIFDDDLDSKMSNVYALGTLLNYDPNSAQNTTLDHVRNAYYVLMNERLEEGLEAKPSMEENKRFLRLYPFVNGSSLGNFVRNHKTGGGVRAIKQYTETELNLEQARYQKSNKDWLVMHPRTCASWRGEPSGQATWDALDKITNKVIFIFWAKTKAQTEKEYQDKIEEHLTTRWAKRYKLEVKVIFLQSK